MPDAGAGIVRESTAKLHELHDAKAAIEEQIREQADRAAAGLRLHVAERELEGEVYSAELVRELYWKHPDVRVSDIAAAIGARTTQEVLKVAGPGRFEEPCRGGCGRIVVRVAKSRSAAHWGGYRWAEDPRMCEECNRERAKERERREAEWRARSTREHAEEVALLEEAIASGAQPSARYVEYPGVPGTWRERDED